MISVKDLIEGRKTGNSSSFHLCGRLHTVTSTTTDNNPRGSLLLLDILTGQDAILCQVDRTFHDLQDAAISITYWTYIVLESGLGYLQFTMDSVFRLGSSVGNILEEKSLARRSTLQLLVSSSSNFSCVNPRQLATVYAGDMPCGQQGITVVGCLSAKSILYTKHGSQACFIVELKDLAKLYTSTSTSTSSFSSQPFQWTVPVVFKGDCLIKYYTELQVGRCYVFTQLQTTIMTTSSTLQTQQQHQRRKKTKRSVLTFHPVSSSFLELKQKGCQHLLSNYNQCDAETTSFDIDSPIFAAATTRATILPLATLDTNEINLKTYTGVVTRVVDRLFGVYELDHQILLCLFHYLGYSENCPFRLGSKLTISHCHVLSLDSLSKVSPLLDLDWNAPKMAHFLDGNNDGDDSGECQQQISFRYILVACMRSDVRIDRFMDTTCDKMMESVDKEDMDERHFKHLVYTHCIARHLNFTALVRQLELFASVKKKFGFLVKSYQSSLEGEGALSPLIWLGKGIIERIFSTTGSRSIHGQGDLYGDFFQHGYSCLAVNESTNLTRKVVLDSCPTLHHLISTIMNNDIAGETLTYKLDHVPLIEIPPSFITSHADVTRYCYDAKTKDTDWVIGLVDALPDGRMYFMDDTYRIVLLVDNSDGFTQSASGTTERTARKVSLGHMYVIKRFHLVVEKLTLFGKSQSLEQRYMMCDYQDMIHLAAFTPKAINTVTLAIHVPSERDDRLRLSHFMMVDDQAMELDISIYNIMELMPTMMVRDEDGAVGFEKWIRVIRYGLQSRTHKHTHLTITENGKPELATLVFTSKMDSLSYLGDLQEGSWFGLTLMDEADQFIIPATHQNEENDTEEQLTFFVDRKKHQLYPVIHYPGRIQIDQPQQDVDSRLSLQQGNTVYIESAFVSHPRPPLPVNIKRWANVPPVLGVAEAIGEDKQTRRQKDRGKDSIKKTGLVAIHGTVLFKGFTMDSMDTSVSETGDSDENDDTVLFQRLGVGLGRRGMKIFLRLRQVDGLETTDIYIGGDMHHLMYTLGAIPGNTITIFRVERRKASSSQKVYFTACPYTYIQSHPQLGATLFQDLLAMENTAEVPTMALSRFIPSQETDRDEDGGIANTVFKVTVTIRRILKMELQWICTTCGMEWIREKCYGNCDNGSTRVFRAEAKVQVSDGTADVLAMIDGEALVFRLLMLLPSQEEALKQAVLHHGTLVSGNWFGKDNDSGSKPDMAGASLRNGMTLDDLCTRTRRYGRFDLYGKRYYVQGTKEASSSQPSESKMDKLDLRQVSLSGQKPVVQTLAYPFVRVKVEALEFVEPQQQAWKLIEQLS